MRHLLPLLFVAFCATACISNGKNRRENIEYEAAIGNRDRLLYAQSDSIRYLLDRLNQEKGANRALLATQDKYLAELSRQEDALDDLRGNLSNTSARLSRELGAMQEARDAVAEELDSLKTQQKRRTDDFQQAVDKAGVLLRDSLVRYLDDEAFTVTRGSGEVTLSVREDVLFQPKSVDKLADGNEVVFRAVMDALQANPLLKLTVVGHTDNRPNPRRGTDNLAYSALRATRVAEELASTYYLSPNRVVAAGQGEYSPLQSNATEEGRRANRRVDFTLRNNVGNLLRELEKIRR